MSYKMGVVVCSLLAVVLTSGCATQSWTEEQMKASTEKARKDFKIQNEKLMQKVAMLKTENTALYKLLNGLQDENTRLHKNVDTLNEKLIKLESSIASTEAKTLKNAKSYSKENDKKIYNFITAQQKKHIDDLTLEMEKVAKADNNAQKLREIIQKILKAYNTSLDNK